MPYDPNALDESQKAGTYRGVWFGLGASAFLVAANVISLGHVIEGFASLIVGVHFITFTTYSRLDDYFRTLTNIGARWALLVTGLWFAAQGLATIFEGFYGAGVTAAGAVLDASDTTFALPSIGNSAFFVLSLASAAFYAGFAWQYWRDRS